MENNTQNQSQTLSLLLQKYDVLIDYPQLAEIFKLTERRTRQAICDQRIPIRPINDVEMYSRKLFKLSDVADYIDGKIKKGDNDRPKRQPRSRKGGRPVGSKNKPKNQVTEDIITSPSPTM